LEYIQCPHCLKKFGVNDQVRSASGKSIRCKSCKESFEITIFSTPSPQPSSEQSPEETADDTAKDTSEETSKKNTQLPEGEQSANTEAEQGQISDTHTKKHTVQIVISAVLGLFLIVALAIYYQVSNSPKPITTPQEKLASQTTDRQTEESSLGKETDNQQEKRDPKFQSFTHDPHQGPSNPSNECKQAATNHWFTDYMLTNGNIAGREYIHLLDESSRQTKEVRELCKDKYVASKITEAAKSGEIPTWIKAEIEARNSSQHETTTKRASDW